MKIRNGFVSNSSSSSFCIYKKLMTEDQIVTFRQLLESKPDDDWSETYIGETEKYFIGKLDMHDNRVYEFIRKNFKCGDYADYC